MKFSPRDDRKILSRMRKQKKYPPRQKTWKTNAAISRMLEQMHRGANKSYDFGFGSVEDLLNPVEDGYYVSTHSARGADASTEMGGWADSPRTKLALGLGAALVVAWKMGWLKGILG
jgi:hypothetical protein